MVAFKIFWFSSNLNFTSPYKNKLTNNLSTRKGISYAHSLGNIPFMKVKVAFKIFWFSANLNFSSPYKSKCTNNLSTRKEYCKFG